MWKKPCIITFSDFTDDGIKSISKKLQFYLPILMPYFIRNSHRGVTVWWAYRAVRPWESPGPLGVVVGACGLAHADRPPFLIALTLEAAKPISLCRDLLSSMSLPLISVLVLPEVLRVLSYRSFCSYDG
jgi:hypothetical protein